MGLSATTLSALEQKWFDVATPIQAACIPILLKWTKDIIGQAATWTGKTAAFAIPMIENIDTSKNVVQAIILTPTRELAIQVAEEIASLKGNKRLSIALLYGWAAMGTQIQALRQGVHLVVWTPGRVIDHLEKKRFNLSQIRYFVLDEADEMLNMGFLEDIEKILKGSNPEKQMLCFSATMPAAIKKVAERNMKEYELVKVESQQLAGGNTEQIYVEVYERDKFEALCRIIDNESEMYGIIFCRTKRECDEIGSHLQSRWYLASALHGDMDQKERERILGRFKKKQAMILVATDVAARGIDVNNLSHVINYHIPQDPESYTHRIGRTGRAGNQGTAITFITPSEYRKLAFIKRATNSNIKKEAIPSIESVVTQKKQQVMGKIKEAMGEELGTFKALAEEMKQFGDADQILPALLKIAFADQLEISKYKQIQEVQWSSGGFGGGAGWTGKTRLFIARGRAFGYGPKELLAWIKEETGVETKDFQEVTVLEEFSFVTCPFEEAETIIDTFRRMPGRSLVSRSKDKTSAPRSWGSTGWGGRRYWGGSSSSSSSWWGSRGGYSRWGRPEGRGGYQWSREGGRSWNRDSRGGSAYKGKGGYRGSSR